MSGCPHLEGSALASLGRLLRRLVYPTQPTDHRLRARVLRCSECGSKGGLMVLCGSCVHAGCRVHAASHAKAQGHSLGLEATTGELFCAPCKDVVYSPSWESVRRGAENGARRWAELSLVHRWNPDEEELELLAAPDSAQPLASTASLGLRGLLNMGNTCFMSCILQALAHTPLLRDYFLSDQHRCPPHNPADPLRACLMCLMAQFFQEMYGGEKKTMIPYRMLHLVWVHARHLAGYEQQDAHEFFIAALDVLHRHSRSSKALKAPGQECGCIIDRIFTGRLQSDVWCGACGGTSRTVDPYWDMSLDLGATPVASLHEALNRFTRPEVLGAEARCSMCGAIGSLSKQLSLLSVPIVACFHLKRFSAASSASASAHRKLKADVAFPQFLDLTDFTAQERTRLKDKENGAQPMEPWSPAGEALRRSENKYALFAVVNHHGTMESGHYTCFVRQPDNQWFQADDHVMRKARLEQVLASEGYLLFYHQHFLNYH